MKYAKEVNSGQSMIIYTFTVLSQSALQFQIFNGSGSGFHDHKAFITDHFPKSFVQYENQLTSQCQPTFSIFVNWQDNDG